MPSHGQASVARTFSLNNIIHNFNMKEISIISRKLIIDYMKSNYELYIISSYVSWYKIAIETSLILPTALSRVLEGRTSKENENEDLAQIEIITNEILKKRYKSELLNVLTLVKPSMMSF